MKTGISHPKQRFTARAFALSFAAFAVTSVSYTVLPGVAVAQGFQFANVRIEGAERVSADTILAYAGIARGQAVSRGELNDAYQGVLGSGLFETVEFIPQGNTLVIRVSEYPVVSRISIEGNSKISDDALSPMLTTKVRRVYSPADAEADAATLAEAYEVKGQLIATVTPKIIRRDNNRVDVVFEVVEGKGVEVERLTFVGNRHFSDARLRRVLQTKQAGLLRFIIGADTYAKERVEFDKRVLTDFYTSRGYADFQILNVAAEFSRERNAYFMTFNLREGLKYDFGQITTSSSIPGVDAAEFQKVANIRSGQTYSPIAVDTVIERMERLATKKGIDFLRVDPQVTRSPRTQTLDINFTLVRGPRAFVQRIDIEGNATTLDKVVRRQFRVVEGDPFNPREIREAAERIRALGFFSNADVQAREGSSPEQMIVDVNVEEKPTGSFTFGANYSVSDGANLIASFSENNFLGRGQKLSFSLTTDIDDGSLSFNFVEPAFLGRNVAFGLSAGLGTSQPGYAEHSLRRAYVSPSLTFPVSANGRLTVDYRGEISELKEDEDYLTNGGTYPDLIQQDIDSGRVTAHMLGYNFTYDNRRSGLNPNAGVILSFGQDYAGLIGGDVDFIRTTAKIAGETKVWNDEVTLRATLEGGAIHSDDDTMVQYRYFNNSSIIRGFEPGGIGPRDEDTGLALGGNYYAVARLEANFPLGLPEEYGLSGGLFYDHGSVWGLNNPGTVDDELHWRSVVGASLFWTTPLGPLRFNFTKALQKEDYDEEQTFDLTISTSF